MPTMREKIDKFADLNGVEILTADGFDDAIVGLGVQASVNYFVIYSYEKCLELLEKQGLSYEDAVEHLEFNVLGAYVGPGTPIFLETLSEFEE
jgi:hypothetical protein